MKKVLWIGILFIFVSTACEKLFMKPNSITSPEAIFQEYASLVKEKYAMLDFKEVDIDFLTDSIRATFSNDMSDTAVLWKLTHITEQLRDGHSNLIAYLSDGAYGYVFDPKEGYEKALDEDLLDSYYFNGMTKPLNPSELIDNKGKYRFVYGRFEQYPNLAYFRIPSFSDKQLESNLETIFESFQGADGLVLDVRDNGGGDPSLATKVASYFMENTTYTGFERFKTGPGLDDFSDSPSYITPVNSTNRFINNVVVLTDRGVFSATTTLCYNLAPLSQVTFLGQKTGGGSGSVTDGFLANGWSYSLSVSEFIDFQGNHLDDGVEPDVIVSLDTLDQTKDELIESALLILQ